MLKPGRPRHEQISDWLRDRIEDGTYAPDDQLPSESQLGERFGVSRITVRRALQTLENEGLIYRRQGLGSFAQQRPVRQGLVRLTDFVEDMAEAGLEASSRVVFHAPVAAPADVADALALEPETRVVRLDRLRLGNGDPVAFDHTWLPPFYAQLLEGHDLERETIYHILENHYDLPIVSGRFRIEAVNAPDDVADHLQAPSGDAMLQIERTSLTHQDKRVYFQRRYYKRGRVAYELDLKREPHAAGAAQGLVLQDFEPVFKKDP